MNYLGGEFMGNSAAEALTDSVVYLRLRHQLEKKSTLRYTFTDFMDFNAVQVSLRAPVFLSSCQCAAYCYITEQFIPTYFTRPVEQLPEKLNLTCCMYLWLCM